MSHPASLAFSVALLLERLSKSVQPAPPSVPLPRFSHRGGVADLRIEQPLRALERPPRRYEFIREDEYHAHVERLFGVARVRERIVDSLARQGLMRAFGVTLLEVGAGSVTLELPITDLVSQQNGFVHAGAIASLLDSACGLAALTMMDENSDVLAVEFKINFVAPALGVSLRAVAEVIKSGRTITLCTARAYTVDAGGAAKLVALMQATMLRTGSSQTEAAGLDR